MYGTIIRASPTGRNFERFCRFLSNFKIPNPPNGILLTEQNSSGILGKEFWRSRKHSGSRGILEKECWGRNPGGGILGEESWRRNPGRGVLEEEPRRSRRYFGRLWEQTPHRPVSVEKRFPQNSLRPTAKAPNASPLPFLRGHRGTGSQMPWNSAFCDCRP